MWMAQPWGLLWMLLASGLGAAEELAEEKVFRTEGQDLQVPCAANVRIYADSQKAWQRLLDGGEVQTLAVTERPMGRPTVVRVGRNILRDDPLEGKLTVQMTDLRVEDSGLYRCVIYHPPAQPILLSDPFRLLVSKGPSVTPASGQNPPALSPALRTTRDPSTRHRAVTQPIPRPPAVITSPGPGVNLTDVTAGIRVPTFTFIILVACGLVTKSLVSIVLCVVTQRSFGS
ncbi:triggering receptor expressed on myeloid cells 1 [Dipodomys spectabilis]|uniref:triggering receptor expressed on myeloid cells 1 n=1 Tax=Dipodomys spectabilis TaxID=105255 RepID=UPI001C54363C|nr:triggering receptor expressed on myeloid cells 1 [Dipodomys spectabilis]XP_042527924.1 triggering receptor expressed on myeloid cells 1 [Dipodomys spectabilis]